MAVLGTRVPPPPHPPAASRIFSSLQELSQLPFILDDLECRVGTYQVELKGMDLMAMDMLEAMEAAKVSHRGSFRPPSASAQSSHSLFAFPVAADGHDQCRKRVSCREEVQGELAQHPEETDRAHPCEGHW